MSDGEKPSSKNSAPGGPGSPFFWANLGQSAMDLHNDGRIMVALE